MLRSCVDFRSLNILTHSDAYPLPRIEDRIDSLGEGTVMRILDGSYGYRQTPVAPADQENTAFTSYPGAYQYQQIPFGLKNAPANFQLALHKILEDVRWQIHLLYLNDMVVFS